MNVFELFGTIAIDQSEAERGLDKTVKHARDTETALEKTFKRIGGYIAAAFSVAAVVNFGKTCTQVFASVAAEESAFAQIMGDYSDTANAKLNAVADQTGITATRMTGAMTSLTAKFKGLGYNVEDATTLAADGLLIAADASAFWDMSLDESMSHLNSFINGSYEGGEAIGLFANDTQMAAYAIEKGIVADTKAWAALDEATKQATRLDYAKTMMEQSGATGQAAKEADAYANVLANLQEAWRKFQAVIGKPLLEKFVLPAMQKLNEFMPILTESVQNGIEWLGAGFDKIASYFTDVFTEDGLNMEALPKALTEMFRDVVRKIPELLSSIGRAAVNGWTGTVWPAIQSAFKVLFGIELPEWSEIKTVVSQWWEGDNGVKAAIAAACNWTLKLFGQPADVTQDDVSDILSTWWANTVGFVQNACTWVLSIFQQPLAVTLEQVSTVLSGWWTATKALVQKACNWALDLFGAPEGTTEEKVQAVLSTWWSGVTGWVANACNWTLNLFGKPAAVTQEDVSNVLSSWWSNTVAFVQNACTWVLNLFTNPTETMKQVKAKISGWWTSAKGWVSSACSWVLQMFDPPAGDPVQVVKDWWDGIKPNIESALGIDLSNIDVAGVFTAATSAIEGVIDAAKKFYSNIVAAIALDEEGKTNLNKVLSGLFDAGIQAVGDLLTVASTLVSSIVVSITGDEESAEMVKATLGGIFDGVKEKMDALIADALTFVSSFTENFDIESLTALGESVSGAFTAAVDAWNTLKSTAKTLMGDLYTAITGQEMTPESVGEKVAVVFNCGIDAITNLTGTAKTFFTDLSAALGDPDATLTQKVSSVFEACKDSLNGLLSAAGHFFTDLYVAITGDTEGAKKLQGFIDDPLGTVAKMAGGLTETVSKAVGVDFTDESTWEHVYEYARAMYRNPASYGFTEHELDTLMNIVGRQDPSVEGYYEAAQTIVDAWMAAQEKTEKNEDTGLPGENSSLLNLWQNHMSQSAQDIKTAVQEGIAAAMSSVTITANIETGNVVLDTGVVAGAVTPKVNIKLGTIGKLISRGGV